MKKVLSNQVVLLGLAIFSAITITSMRLNNKKVINQDQNLQQIAQKNHELRQQITILENKITTATSSFAKEKRLRDELLLQKPGEYVVLLDKNASDEAETESNEQVSEKSVWQQWREVLW